MKKKWLMCAALAALAVLAVAYRGHFPRAKAEDTSLQKVLEAGQLIVGLDAGFPPMSFADEKGEIVGFDCDMAQEVCKRLGVALVKRPIKWVARENELYNGTINCIGSLPVTPALNKVVCLTEPYIKDDLVFVVPGSSSARWLQDLKGKTVGVQYDSTTQRALNSTNIRKDVMVVLLDDNLSILLQLREGKLDAGLVDSLSAYHFIYSSSERYFILTDSLGEEKLAIGFKRNDRKLRDRVQQIIGEMNVDGTLAEISKKWFGSDITIVK